MKELYDRLEESGFQGRIVPIEHLQELREGIQRPLREGLLKREVYERYFAWMNVERPADLLEARSVIIVAVPQGQVRVTFAWEGQSHGLIVPPTYLWARDLDAGVRRLLAEVLQPAGYRLVPAYVPRKLLAVRSGLAAYGKNNISYVPGRGSFHRLVAFYSDAPCTDDPWREPQMLERCQNCQACQRACPSGAITTERFLLRAERCITFHNEMDHTVPLPSWLDPTWMTCLVGCMHCQLVCPENRDFAQWVQEGPAFSEEETSWLLQGATLDELPHSLADKVRKCSLDDEFEVLPRNLRIMLPGAAS